MDNESKITYFAETDFRNKKTRFGIKAHDRARHVYVIGKTGVGKSTMLENMAIQDIQSGEGMAFIDPHGGTAEKLLDYVPQSRIKDVIYFAPFDLENPISFNVMEDVGVDKRHLVASGLMSSFKKIWVDAWSARMEYILNNVLLALLEYPDSTLLGVNRMLADKDYRKKVVDNLSDPAVKSFWVDEFAKYGDKYMQEAGAAIQNKIGQFTSNPLIRNIIGQPKSSFDIRSVMDEKKILIMNLSKGRIGEQNASLLGGMLITKIYLGAMSRADASEKELSKLPYFYFYVDEFQSFASESFADILSEARKYKLSLTIAHQYIEQMPDEVRAAVFGNVGTMVVFRVGSTDAEVFEKEFAPTFIADDIVNLGFAQIYLRLMVDGIGTKPFSATTLLPIARPEKIFKEEIVQNSRKANSRTRSEIEEKIRIWHETKFLSPKPPRPDIQGEQTNNFPATKAFLKPVSFQQPQQNFVPRSVPRNTFAPYQSRPVSGVNLPKPAPSTNQSSGNTISSKMKNILSVLEGDKTKEIPVAPQKPIPPPEKPFVSLSSLPQKPLSTFKDSKAPSPENVSSLKEALMKAQALSAQKKAETPSQKVENINSIKENKKAEDSNSGYQKKKPQYEIPEDILRKAIDEEA